PRQPDGGALRPWLVRKRRRATLHEPRHWHNWLTHPGRYPTGDHGVGVGQNLISFYQPNSANNLEYETRSMTKRLRCVEAIVLAPASFGYAAAQGQSASSPGFFLNVDSAKLYYEECGSAPQAVVLVHDGVLHSAAWDDVWPEFCKHFHTIRYDRRGYGRSPVATQGYYATDDLAAILHHLKLKRVTIVGSSHGGEISINFTLEHPEMVDELVLVGAVVGGMPYTKHFLARGDALGKP